MDYGDGSGIQDLVVNDGVFTLNHVYGDDGAFTATVTIRNDIGLTEVRTLAVTAINVAPELTFAETRVSADEGLVAVNSGVFADVDADNVSISADIGTVTVDQAQGTWQWSFNTEDGPIQSGAVTLTAVDEDGGTSRIRFDLTVNNVAPALSVAAAEVTVDEGQQASNTGTFADVAVDEVVIRASVGTVLWDSAEGVWSWRFDTADGPAESQTVVITAEDKDGAVTHLPFELVVRNLAPELTVAEDAVSVTEGSTAVNGGRLIDVPGDLVAVSASVGSVTWDAVAGTWDWRFVSADGPDETQSVIIRAEDKDSAVTEIAFVLTVLNAAPAVSTDDSTRVVDEGQTAVNTGRFSDAGNDVVDLWSDVGRVTRDISAGTWEWEFDTTDGPAESQSVTIYARDEDGAVSTAEFDLVVNNVARILQVAADETEVDNAGVAVNTGTFSDAGADVVEITAPVGSVTQDTATDGGWSWSYDASSVEAETLTVTVTATDADGASTSLDFTVIVNLPPTLEIAGPEYGVRGQTLTFTLTATDPNAADQGRLFTYVIDWGDGTPVETVVGPAVLVREHVYREVRATPYRVTATVTDSRGKSSLEPTLYDVTISRIYFDGETLLVGGSNEDDQIKLSRNRHGVIEVKMQTGKDKIREHFGPGVTLVEIYGQAGDDKLLVDQKFGRVPVRIEGGSGDDRVQGGDGDDTILGGDGDDRIEGRRGADLILGGDGDDRINGGSDSPADRYAGGADILVGGYGDDRLKGHKGNDVLIGGYGEDRLDGDAGEDLLIGGYTTYDEDEEALADAFAAWGADAGIADRILGLTERHLRDGDRRIFDDDERDKLLGGAGSDWFVAVTGKDDTADKLLGYKEKEDELFEL